MGTQIRFDQAVLPPIVIFIILIILGITVFRSYRKEGFRRYPRSIIRTLIALRILALAAIGFVLLKPDLFHLRETREPGRLLLLVDVSESMSISDAPGKRYIRARRLAGEVSESIGERLDTRAYGFSAFPEPVDRDAVESLEIQASGATNIGGSLREAVQADAEAGIAAAVVITDGQQNTGPGPAEVAGLLRRRNIPVFAVGVGSETAYQDLELREFSGPRLVFRGEAARLTVRVVNFGFEPSSVPFRVRVDKYRPPPSGAPAESPAGSVVVERPLSLPPPGTEEQHTLSFTPKYEGIYRLVAEIDALPGEEVIENNSKAFDLEVTRKRLRVLVIESSPRWEYTFLLRALRMDRRFAVGGLVEIQDGDYRYQGAELFPRDPMAGKIHHPPLDPDWSGLEAVVLGDVPADHFAPGSLERLRRRIEEQGLALAVIPGERTAPLRGLESTPLGPLLPFRDLGVLVPGPFPVSPTASGANHPIMQVGPTTIDTRQFWQNLAPVWAVYRVGEPAAGALVLARAVGPEATYPVIGIREAGLGRVLELAVEDTWRWRVADPTGDIIGAAPATFWRQAIRWLMTGRTADPGAGLRLLVEKSSFTRGERVELEAQVDTSARVAPGTVRVSAEIIGPDGIAETVQFSALDTGTQSAAGAAYRYSFVPLSFGSYLVRASAHAGEVALGRDEKVFFVSESDLERVRTSLNRQLLQELAASTGGEYLDAGEADRLPDLIPDRETVQVEPVTTRLWDNPFVFLVFVAAVGAEWFIRKRRDMA